MPISKQWDTLRKERQEKVRRDFAALKVNGSKEAKSRLVAKLAIKYGVSFNTIYNDLKQGDNDTK